MPIRRNILRALGIAIAIPVLVGMPACTLLRQPTSSDYEIARPLANTEWDWGDALESLEETTATDCSGTLPCVEAWTTDAVHLVRFATRDEAEQYASSLATNVHIFGANGGTPGILPRETVVLNRFVVAELVDGAEPARGDAETVTYNVFDQMPLAP